MRAPSIRSGWLCLWALLLGFGLLHHQLWSAFPPDVDPINFVTALGTYDLSIDSPHPPGYPLFVGMGRLYAPWVGALHAYQAVDLTLVLLAATGLFALIRRQAGWPAALLGVCLLVFNPLLLAATTVQESYVSDAVFGVAVLTWITFNHHHPRRLLLGVFALFLAFGMIRFVSTALLAPLCVVATYRLATQDRLKQALQSGVALGLGAALAWGLTVHLAGGLDTYTAASNRVMGAAVKANSVLAGASWQAHLAMLIKLYGWLGYLLAPLMLSWAAMAWLSRQRSTPTAPSAAPPKAHATDGWILAAWILPPLAFYSAIYFLKPTYLLIFLPPLILLVIGMGARGGRRPSTPAVLILSGVLSAAMLLLYVSPDRQWPKPLYRHSHQFVVDSDQAWRQLTEGVQQCHAGPDSLLIWQGPLPLPVHAVRLLSWPGQAAALNAHDATPSYFKPDTLEWITPTPDPPTPLAANRPTVRVSGTGSSLSVQCVTMR